MDTAGHKRLVGSTWVRRYPCTFCHADTVDLGGQITDFGKHVNENVDVVMGAQWYIVGYPPPAWDANTETCSNVYCHSDGTTVSPAVRDFAWTDLRIALTSTPVSEIPISSPSTSVRERLWTSFVRRCGTPSQATANSASEWVSATAGVSSICG